MATPVTLEERRKALERKFVENRPPLAYAKLTGRVGDDDSPFDMLITHLPVELGRGPLSATPGPRLSLGEQKAISRQHARIQWNQDRSCFELHCLGKNGIFAAGKFIAKDKSVELASKMPIKIGPARLYFLAAVRSVCSTMSGFKMLQRAFDKAKAAGRGANGLTTDELEQQIMDMFPKSEAELGGRDNLRAFIRSYMVEDDVNFELVASSDPPRYKIKASAATATASSTATPTTTLGKNSAAADETTAAARKKQRTDAA